MDNEKIEIGLDFIPKWNNNGLMPVVTIDHKTGKVLMLAYANEEALILTLQNLEAYYYSRSRQELWHKGATSGQIQKIKHISIDCDQDTLIYQVEATSVNCHRGYESCFYRDVIYKEGKISLQKKSK